MPAYKTDWLVFQALDQCEVYLNALGVTRVSADDPAHAAQVSV